MTRGSHKRPDPQHVPQVVPQPSKAISVNIQQTIKKKAGQSPRWCCCKNTFQSLASGFCSCHAQPICGNKYHVHSAFFTTAAHSRTVENSDTLWQVNNRKSLLSFFANREFSLIIVDAFILVCRWSCKRCWRIDFCLSISLPFLWHFSHF